MAAEDRVSNGGRLPSSSIGAHTTLVVPVSRFALVSGLRV